MSNSIQTRVVTEEVADAALSAFRRAEAAIAQARKPIVNDGDGTTRKRVPHELPAYGRLLDRLYIPVERLKLHSNVFEELAYHGRTTSRRLTGCCQLATATSPCVQAAAG